MKRYVFLMALGLFVCSFGTTTGSAQQVPGRGFSVLLCAVERGPQPGNAQVGFTINSDTGPIADGIGFANVTLTHGQTSSTHDVTYFDANETLELDCGDLILSVT